MPINTNTPVKLLNDVVVAATTTAGSTTTVAATTTVAPTTTAAPTTTVAECATVGATCLDGTIYVSPTLRTTPSSAGTKNWDAAVAYCTGLTNVYTHSDWHLPTKTEVDVLYANKGALSTGNGYHWSSTEYNASLAWAKDFSNGIWYYDWTVKSAGFAVRCVRVP
jgi:hypothetical protein